MTTTTIERSPGCEQMTCEAGGWLACRVPRPELATDAAALLSQAVESRRGNLRLAIDQHQAYLLGELRDPDGLLNLSEAHELLFAATGVPASQVAQVEVACVLGETGHEWSQPEDGPNQWQAAANDSHGHRCDLTATIVQNGVEVRSALTAMQGDFAGDSELALHRFLARAQGHIRFARFTLRDSRVSVVSFAAADRLDVELPDSVAAVVTACGLVWRERLALANTTVARAYLETTS